MAPDDRPVAANDETMAEVGARIRALRRRRGLTLRQLGEATGLSTSMLSMLERGVANASIGSLVGVASSLGVHMADLFGAAQSDEEHPVLRADEQTAVRTEDGAVRRVLRHEPATGLEAALNEYLPGGSSGPEASSRSGREIGMVVEGRLGVDLGGGTHLLEVGDVIAFASSRPHRIHNDGPGTARAVWLNLDG